MKKIFTSAFLFLAFLTAQAGETPEQLKAQATEQTRALVQKIGLNELEYIKIKNLTYNKLVAIQEINEMYSNDPEMKEQKLKAVEEAYNKDLTASLSPKQQQSYLAMNQNK